MKIIVQPQKGSSYKLLFYDGRHVLGTGFVDLMDTPQGTAPDKVPPEMGREERLPSYAFKRTHRPVFRDADVRMVKPNPLFETFLFQTFKSGRDRWTPAVCACWMSGSLP